MKKFISSFNGIMTIILGVLGLWAVGLKAKQIVTEHDEKINAEWRAAAAPVFNARHVPELANHATPRDLVKALDARSALTRAESYKLDAQWQKPSLMTVVQVSLVDRDPDNQASKMGHYPW
jgi:hypothetical protein